MFPPFCATHTRALLQLEVRESKIPGAGQRLRDFFLLFCSTTTTSSLALSFTLSLFLSLPLANASFISAGLGVFAARPPSLRPLEPRGARPQGCASTGAGPLHVPGSGDGPSCASDEKLRLGILAATQPHERVVELEQARGADESGQQAPASRPEAYEAPESEAPVFAAGEFVWVYQGELLPYPQYGVLILTHTLTHT